MRLARRSPARRIPTVRKPEAAQGRPSALPNIGAMSRLWPVVTRFTFHPRHLSNRLRQYLELARGASVLRSWPSFITMELSNHCNLDCLGCPQSRMTRSRGNMDFELFRHVLEQVKGHVEVVDLDLFGEFTFNPRWKEMVGWARAQGFFTVLNTSATRLTDGVVDDLVESGLDYLNLSVTGSTAERYEAYHRGARYADTMARIERFLSRNRSIYTVVQMIRTTATDDDVEGFLKAWRDPRVDAVRVKGYMAYDPARRHLDGRAGAPVSSKPCIFPWRTLVVTQDGSVVPCCVDYDKRCVVGDARLQPIEAIWNGDAMRDIRARHMEGRCRDVPLCSHCRPVTAGPMMLLASFVADDAMRRKLLPIVEGWLPVLE